MALEYDTSYQLVSKANITNLRLLSIDFSVNSIPLKFKCQDCAKGKLQAPTPFKILTCD